VGLLQKAKDANGKTLDITLGPLTSKVLAEAAASRQPYTWVVVMAGINDLGAGDHKADQIMPKLIEVSIILSASPHSINSLPLC
jgi:lysophospholipase L1-like esterase